MIRKRIVRTIKLPYNLPLDEQAEMWVFLNRMLEGTDEIAIWNDGRFWILIKKRYPKFRYRALAQATKFFLKSKRQE